MYDKELEKVSPFNDFEDNFETFPLYRGRLADDDDDDDSGRTVGKFKVIFHLFISFEHLKGCTYARTFILILENMKPVNL